MLLLSASEKFPTGLANRNGKVGKYFACKQLPRTLGILPGRTVNRFTGPSAQGVLIDDFLSDNFDHTGLGFVGGASMGVLQQTQQHGGDEGHSAAGRPGVGARLHKEYLLKNWNSYFAIEAQPEGLMYDANFLDLDPDVRDTSGLGLPVI